VTVTRVRGPQFRVTELLPVLASWIPQQRWFGGKDREVERVRLLRHTVLASPGSDSPAVHHLIVAVDQPERSEAYQLILSVYPVSVPALAHVRIAELDWGCSYDALYDPYAAGLLLQYLANADRIGALTFLPEPAASIPLGQRSTVLTGEQSNTSVVYGDIALLKVFRRLQVGTNPDIEVHRALTRAGTSGIAPLLGSIDGEWVDPTSGAAVTGSLGMLQRFLDMAIDGWVRATTSVRAWVAGTGGGFTTESEQLGAATAEVLQVMARVLPHGTWDDTDVGKLAEAMHARLSAALARVPALGKYAAGLRAAYDALNNVATPLPVQRVHGDLHLGQVLQTSSGWVLVDFEGEPAKPLAERVALQPVARDLAGMLRSFEYAARHLLVESPFRDPDAGPGAEPDPERNPEPDTEPDPEPDIVRRADQWANDNRDAFCAGYARRAGRDPRSDGVLLRAFEADKAVYEAVYEANNRPHWLPIPIATLERLARS
jgi:maltokinase